MSILLVNDKIEIRGRKVYTDRTFEVGTFVNKDGKLFFNQSYRSRNVHGRFAPIVATSERQLKKLIMREIACVRVASNVKVR